ncbi:MAG: WD40/YVTN/BNR-like repeat-containing protein [bacterium]
MLDAKVFLGILLAFVLVFLSGHDHGSLPAEPVSEMMQSSARPIASFYSPKNIHPQTRRLRYNPARRRFTPALSFIESPTPNGLRIASAAQTRRLRYGKRTPPESDRAQPRLYASLVNSRAYVVGAKLAASGLYAFEGDTTWRHIGWNHPRVYGIAVDPNDANIIFLACGNGVLRTLDRGRSWRLTTDWRVTEALDIAIASTNPERVYVATAYGVWRSENRGDIWLESNRGLKRTFTQAVEVDHRNPKRLFAGTESGLYLSGDGAQSWTLVGPAEVTVLDIQQGTAAPEMWLAGTQTHGVWLSGDDGRTWQKAEGVIAQASIYSVAIDPTDRRNLAAVGWGAGVFISDDAGQSWRQQKTGLPTQNFYAVAFHPTTTGQIWAATVEAGVFKSGDFGRTWKYHGLRGALVFDLTWYTKR